MMIPLRWWNTGEGFLFIQANGDMLRQYQSPSAFQMIEKLKKMGWFLMGKCRFCGGKVWSWDANKHFCEECDERQ